MKLRSAILLMLAGLAGGTGIRLAFHWPDSASPSRRSHSAGLLPSVLAAGPVAKPETSASRPDESAILTSHSGSRMRLLMAWLPGAGDEELTRMASALTGPDQDENLSIRLLMARWAEVNPEAMLAWAKARRQEDRWGSEFYTSNAVEAWARVDFDRAWAAATGGLPGLRSSALIGLTAVDPARCLGLLRADPSLLDLAGFATMDKVIARIASREPAGAAELLTGGSAERLRRFAGPVALAWAKADPAAAVAWIRQLGPDVCGGSVEGAAKWIAGHAPEQLPALLESLPAGRIRSIAEAEGFSSLAASDAAAARRQLEAMPDSPSRQYFRGLLLKELARRGDDTGAIALAAQIGWQVRDEWCPGTERVITPGGSSTTRTGADDSSAIQTTLQDLMGRIAARNPQEAAAILAKCPPDVVSGLLENGIKADHGAMAAALLASGDVNAQQNAGTVISAWSGRDPAAAAAWVVGHLPAGDERDGMISGILSTWASDPRAMLQWAATVDEQTTAAAWEHVGDQDPAYVSAHIPEFLAAAKSPAVAETITQLELTPEFARDLLRQMPDDLNLDISAAVDCWVREEPEAATAWVRGLPPGLRRNHATAGIVQNLNATGDHEAAFAWAATLPPENRATILTETMDAWGSTDATAAEAAILASSLPPEEQQTLLDSLPPP